MKFTFLPLINLHLSSKIQADKITENWEYLSAHGAFKSLKKDSAPSLAEYQQDVIPATLKFSNLSFRHRYYEYIQAHSHQSSVTHNRIKRLEKKVLIEWERNFNQRNAYLKITRIVPEVSSQTFQAQLFLAGWRLRSHHFSFDVAKALADEYPFMNYDKAFYLLERSAGQYLALIMQKVFDQAVPDTPVRFRSKSLAKPVDKPAPSSVTSAAPKVSQPSASSESINTAPSESSSEESSSLYEPRYYQSQKVKSQDSVNTSSNNGMSLHSTLNILFNQLSSQISVQISSDNQDPFHQMDGVDSFDSDSSSEPSVSSSVSSSSSSAPISSSSSVQSSSSISITPQSPRHSQESQNDHISYLSTDEPRSTNPQPKLSGDLSLGVVNSNGQLGNLTKVQPSNHPESMNSLSDLTVISGNDSPDSANDDDHLL